MACRCWPARLAMRLPRSPACGCGNCRLRRSGCAARWGPSAVGEYSLAHRARNEDARQSAKNFDTKRIYFLTTIRGWHIGFASLTHRGASSGDVPKAERGVASRDRGSVTATREVRETARQALRPGREELAAGSSGGNAGNRSASLPKNATVERREVRVPSPRDARRLASAWPAAPEAWRRAWFCVEDARERAFDAAGRTGARNTRAALGAPLPSVRGRTQGESSGASRRGNESGCLLW